MLHTGDSIFVCIGIQNSFTLVLNACTSIVGQCVHMKFTLHALSNNYSKTLGTPLGVCCTGPTLYW